MKRLVFLSAGVGLAALSALPAHSQPLPQSQYSVYWPVTLQRMADAMTAQLGVSSGDLLPGVPEPMRPHPPGSQPTSKADAPAPSPTRASVQTATPSAGANKKADAPVPPEMLSRDSSTKRTAADIEAMIAQLKDTAWEHTEEDGRFHRYDFLGDGNVMVYQTRDAGANVPRYVQLSQLSAGDAPTGAFIRTRDVTTGKMGTMPILSLTEDVMTYQKRYVRTGEEWPFKKVGPASAALPDGAPEKLDDGFWKIPFSQVTKSPRIVAKNGLQDIAGSDNRTLHAAAIAGAANAGFLISDGSHLDCRSNCFFIVNDFDQGRRRVRRRLIDEAGVAYVGARPEPMLGISKKNEANVMSLRAYDGDGGWKEWRCSSRRGILDCAPTGSKDAPQTGRPDNPQ